MSRDNTQEASPQPRKRKLTAGMVLGGLAVVAVCLVARHFLLAPSANADPPSRFVRTAASRSGARGRARTSSAAAPRTAMRSTASSSQPAAARTSADSSQLKIVATVNGENVTRSDLAAECLRHYGAEVLETLVNRYLIQQECRRRNIEVTAEEVNAEIERMAERFKLPVDQWLELLQKERGLSPDQYASEVVWPMLALRKLAGPKLEVTRQELREHFESQYGEAVKARMIVCDDRATADSVRAAAAADPSKFGELAKDRSLHAPSASLNGMVQPIRKHVGPEEIEQAAFAMRDGEVSEVIPVNGQFVILKREGLQPAVRVAFEQVKMGMIEVIRDKKMRRVANEVFRQLQEQAQVENVFNDPAKSREMPGVAAVCNGHKIPVRELAELCIERHGTDVLEGIINRRLLEQAIESRNLTVTEEDLDREIARAASQMLPAKDDGSPDVDKWLQMVTEQQNISVELYRHDAVWPSVALKKLVGERIEVTDEELQKGYEANFGPRVRCLAIVLDDLRRAQKVWEMARSHQGPDGRIDKEFFGDLAAQYSTDPRGKALRGEVPPIQKHGGQPKLEEEAFSLKPGELSPIIHLAGGGRYVILLCEGQTHPLHVDFASVRDELHADIHEKKLRVAMADYFEELQDGAAIDNYLAARVQLPDKAQTRPAAARR